MYLHAIQVGVGDVTMVIIHKSASGCFGINLRNTHAAHFADKTVFFKVNNDC